MKNSIVRVFASILTVIFLLTSCAPLPPPGTALTPKHREEAQKSCIARYTTMGAIGGAAVGLLLGGRGTKLEGALIGAAAGVALTYAIAYGRCLAMFSDLNSYPVAGTQETAMRIGYDPSQGNITKIESFSLDPAGVSPGGKVKLNGSYYIMAPEGTTEVKVTEKRTVHYFVPSEKRWKELGSVSQEITSALGRRRAEGSFDIPIDVPEGDYKITFTVEVNGKRDEISRDLTVKRGLAMGPTQGQQTIQTAYAADQIGGKAVGSGKVTTVIVTSKRLNLRKEPSTKSQVITTLNQGEIYEVLHKTGSANDIWYKIRLDDGSEGWVAGKFVRIQE